MCVRWTSALSPIPDLGGRFLPDKTRCRLLPFDLPGPEPRMASNANDWWLNNDLHVRKRTENRLFRPIP